MAALSRVDLTGKIVDSGYDGPTRIHLVCHPKVWEALIHAANTLYLWSQCGDVGKELQNLHTTTIRIGLTPTMHTDNVDVSLRISMMQAINDGSITG